MTDKKNNRPVIGVGVLVWREKKILLGQRIVDSACNKASMCWQFPGGHLEDGESVITCAQREVSEETGLVIKNLRHLGFTDKLFSVGEKEYITLLVSADYKVGEAQVQEPEKCASWQWFDYDDLPMPLFEPISIFLAQQQASQENINLYAMHCAAQVLQVAPSDGHK